MERTLHTSIWIDRPLEDVFGFFSEPRNLPRITPPELAFRIIGDAPGQMRTGTIIDYALRVRGLPVRWTSEILDWSPPHRFVDVQRRGPYRKWHHEHRFTPERGGTRIEDIVSYRVPGWILEPLIHRWFIAPDLERIFTFRERVIREQLQRNYEVAS